MVWIVLPRPISSARMPLSRRSYNVAIQSRPTTWYSRSVCFRRKGISVFTCRKHKNQLEFRTLTMLGPNIATSKLTFTHSS